MKSCLICEIIKNPKYLEDTIIYDDGKLIVKAAKGMPVPGHLLVIPKNHINGFAELLIDELKMLYDFVNDISKKLEEITDNKVILFEHGSLPTGRHSQSIVHAHLHIIPYDLTKKNIERLIKECDLKRINDYSHIKSVEYKDYCFFRDCDNNLYLSHSVDFPRSIIFRVIAEQENLGNNYEWRDEKNNRKDYILKTLEIGKKIFSND